MKTITKFAIKSTRKVKEISSPYSTHSAISFFVSAKSLRQIDRLAEWLNRKKKEMDYSFPDIARRSGGLLSQGTAANIANKVYDSVNARTVRGLAKAFDITEQDLWDIVNGVAQNTAPNLEARELPLPAPLWQLLDADAARCKRNWAEHFEAILAGYFGGDPNINLEKLAEMRRGDAIIVQPNKDRRGNLPFLKDDTPKTVRAVKSTKVKN